MPYASQRDRTPHQLEVEGGDWPQPPLNLFFTAGTMAGVIDLSWDDPTQLAANSRFDIVGVNVYRSFDSEFGPFNRISELPVGSLFWRDFTDNELIVGEDVSEQFVMRGDSATGSDGARYVFQVRHPPIVRPGSILPAGIEDVQVLVDGRLARVLRVIGPSGDVEIDPNYYPDVGRQKMTPPVVPSAGSVVTCTYRRNRAPIDLSLSQRLFYRVTTVANTPSGLVETPLDRAVATSNFEIEKLDYIWREAVRRNRWVLAQGGERVLAFIRKRVGIPCPCVTRDPRLSPGYHHQPQGDCPVCYGVGIVGGYEGPYTIMIAPDDAERRISQRNIGRTVEHTYEVWTGPQPLLCQRDFVVKVNGDRYSVGPVRMPSNRGMVLQQHFNIGRLDENHVVYTVPMWCSTAYAFGRLSQGWVGRPVPEMPPTPEPTDKPGIPDERELRGRTVVWEGIMY